MPESSLSLKYSDLLSGVARFLGYSADRSNWSTDQIAEIDGCVQSGVRQFYFPPAIEGAQAGFEWSFLNPTVTLDTAIGDMEQDLPDMCCRIMGDFHFEASVRSVSIISVSEHRILAMHSADSQNGIPRCFAVRSKPGTEKTSGQRLEVVWYPKPDAIYTLKYRYEGYSGKLTDALPYPLGGMKHSETIMESCLAVAEQRANDEKGLHWDQFTSLLIASMAMDRKMGARFFGQMGAPMSGSFTSDQMVRSCGGITYKGVLI
jgi:hypothetical protein